MPRGLSCLFASADATGGLILIRSRALLGGAFPQMGMVAANADCQGFSVFSCWSRKGKQGRRKGHTHTNH